MLLIPIPHICYLSPTNSFLKLTWRSAFCLKRLIENSKCASERRWRLSLSAVTGSLDVQKLTRHNTRRWETFLSFILLIIVQNFERLNIWLKTMILSRFSMCKKRAVKSPQRAWICFGAPLWKVFTATKPFFSDLTHFPQTPQLIDGKSAESIIIGLLRHQVAQAAERNSRCLLSGVRTQTKRIM